MYSVQFGLRASLISGGHIATPGEGGGATLWVVLARASPDNSPPHRSPLVISFLTHPTAYTSILIFIRSPSFTILLALLQDSCNVEAPKLDYFLSYSFIYDHDYVSARFVSLSVSLSLSLIPFLSQSYRFSSPFSPFFFFFFFFQKHP